MRSLTGETLASVPRGEIRLHDHFQEEMAQMVGPAQELDG